MFVYFPLKILTCEIKWNPFYSDKSHMCLIAIASIAKQIFLSALVSWCDILRDFTWTEKTCGSNVRWPPYEIEKKLSKIYYKNQEIWLESGMILFFSSTEPHIVLILFLYFCFKFRLSCSVSFAHQLLKLHLTLQISDFLIFI